jgi:hypothetical protein
MKIGIGEKWVLGIHKSKVYVEGNLSVNTIQFRFTIVQAKYTDDNYFSYDIIFNEKI